MALFIGSSGDIDWLANESPHAVVTTNSLASKGTVGYLSSEKKGNEKKKKQVARNLEGLVQGSDRKEVISSKGIRQTFKA